MLPEQSLAEDEGVLRADGDDQRAAEQKPGGGGSEQWCHRI